MLSIVKNPHKTKKSVRKVIKKLPYTIERELTEVLSLCIFIDLILD